MTAADLDDLAISPTLSRLDKLKVKQRLAELCVQRGISLNDTTSPGQLAVKLDPHTQRQAPHLEVIDQQLTRMLAEPNARVMIWTPSQIGKSTRVSVWFPFWWLTIRPRDRILMASAEATLARRNGAAVRELVRQFGPEYGLNLTADESSKTDWSIRAGGTMRSRGLRGNFTGQPMDLGIIDDPISNRAQAESLTIRDFVWDWYSSVWSQRKAPTYRECIVMCMTGDTPVLMADGRELPLRDVRPGDAVATYENGQVTTSSVVNWKNQGADTIYEITTSSGRKVRANARHPFLVVDEDGTERWARTHTLEPGQNLRAIGGSGGVLTALPTAAVSQREVGDCARRTIPSSERLRDTGRPLSRTERAGCATGTASNPSSSMRWSNSREGCAQYVGSHQMPATPAHTGAASSVSTTITKPARTENCCATTATSQSDTASHQTSCSPQQSTYAVTVDEIVSIVECGREDVFDVQIDRTENFIANGIVSHNTRWHPDDLCGRLLARDGRVEEGGAWTVVHLPAIAMPEDHERGVYADPLGRQPGEPLTHPLITPDDPSTWGKAPTHEAALIQWWTDKRAMSTARDWSSMSQGLPSSAENAILRDADVRDATKPAPPVDELRRVVIGVDPSGGDGEKHDTAGLAAVGLDDEQHAWFLEDRTAILSPMQWPREACLLARDYQATTIVYEKNYGGGMAGQLIAQAWEQLQRDVDPDTGEPFIPAEMNCPYVKGVNARVSKVLRAEPIAQAVLTGRAFFARFGKLGALPNEFTLWQPGSTWSPGALDAAVHAATEVLPAVVQKSTITRPQGRRGTAPGSGQFAGRRRTA